MKSPREFPDDGNTFQSGPDILIPASESARSVAEGMNLILEKMRSERPTLRQYLASKATLDAKSSREWEAEHPGCDMAIWRAGASYAYGDVLRMLERDAFSNDK